MKPWISLWILSMLTGCQTSHKSGLSNRDLSGCPVVAAFKQSGDHQIVACNHKLLKDTIVLPLSYFTEELHLVKLDKNPRALVAGSRATIGAHYILVHSAPDLKIPYKLFDKSGRFITEIGAFGKGPNEYIGPADRQLDEKNNRIYILPWRDDKILVYDLEGNGLAPIRLSYPATRGAMQVDSDRSAVSVITLPVKEGRWSAPYFAWSQDMTGGFINGLVPGFLSIEPENAAGLNEVCSFGNTGEMDFHIVSFKPRNDTLYYYSMEKNLLIPRFTIDFDSSIPSHVYNELPRHFLCSFQESKEIAPRQWLSTNSKNCVVDKTTLKGAYFKLENDFLGNIEINDPGYYMSDGYYTANYEPALLLEKVENALLNKNLSAEMREKLIKLKNSIKETDNNYILYAKLK